MLSTCSSGTPGAAIAPGSTIRAVITPANGARMRVYSSIASSSARLRLGGIFLRLERIHLRRLALRAPRQPRPFPAGSRSSRPATACSAPACSRPGPHCSLPRKSGSRQPSPPRPPAPPMPAKLSRREQPASVPLSPCRLHAPVLVARGPSPARREPPSPAHAAFPYAHIHRSLLQPALHHPGLHRLRSSQAEGLRPSGIRSQSRRRNKQTSRQDNLHCKPSAASGVSVPCAKSS